MNLSHSNIGCHVGEMYGLDYFGDDVKGQIKGFCQAYYGRGFRHSTWIFGDLASRPYLPAIVKYIQDNDLGKVIVTEPALNLNYASDPTHLCIVAVWTLNVEKLQEWWKENNPPPAPKPTPSKTYNIVMQRGAYVRQIIEETTP